MTLNQKDSPVKIAFDVKDSADLQSVLKAAVATTDVVHSGLPGASDVLVNVVGDTLYVTSTDRYVVSHFEIPVTRHGDDADDLMFTLSNDAVKTITSKKTSRPMSFTLDTDTHVGNEIVSGVLFPFTTDVTPPKYGRLFRDAAMDENASRDELVSLSAGPLKTLGKIVSAFTARKSGLIITLVPTTKNKHYRVVFHGLAVKHSILLMTANPQSTSLPDEADFSVI